MIALCLTWWVEHPQVQLRYRVVGFGMLLNASYSSTADILSSVQYFRISGLFVVFPTLLNSWLDTLDVKTSLCRKSRFNCWAISFQSCRQRTSDVLQLLYCYLMPFASWPFCLVGRACVCFSCFSFCSWSVIITTIYIYSTIVLLLLLLLLLLFLLLLLLLLLLLFILLRLRRRACRPSSWWWWSWWLLTLFLAVIVEKSKRN